MKQITFFLCCILLLSGCDNDNDTLNEPTAPGEFVTVTTNGSTQNYNNKIIAQFVRAPLSPVTGTTGVNTFVITAKKLNGDSIAIKLPPPNGTVDYPPVTPASPSGGYSLANIPVSTTAGLSYNLFIQGFNFYDSQPNNLTVFVRDYGYGAIGVKLSGTYYLVGDPAPHSIVIDVWANRDPDYLP